MLLEGVIPQLQLPRHQLIDQQPVRHKPDAVGVAVGIGDLHAGLVVVLDLSLAAGRVGVLLHHRRGEGFRPPHPGTGHLAITYRLIGPLPDAEEVLVGRILSRNAEVDGQQQNQRADSRYQSDVSGPQHRISP